MEVDVELDVTELKPPHGCSGTANQCAAISAALALTPFVSVGKPETECCGEPQVFCKWGCTGACEVTVVQKVNIKIPIRYSVEAEVDMNSVNCDCSKTPNE